MLRPPLACRRSSLLSLFAAPRPPTFARHVHQPPQHAALTGLRTGPDHSLPVPERRKRADAYTAAWRSLAWLDEIRVPFVRPAADGAQPQDEITATRLPSRLRGTLRRDVRRRLAFPVRAWAVDPAQDLLVAVENTEECVLLSRRVRRRVADHRYHVI
jgi:hypothetical protein